jgi:hypothetical protein
MAMSQAEKDAWNRMLAVLVTGGAAGAGIRGLMGVRNMFRDKPKVDPVSSIPQPVPIRIPLRMQEEEDEPMPKLAGLGARPSGRFNWWEIPTGIAAGAGGLFGGWKLVDWLMDKRRQMAMQGELDEAKKDYESALQDQYSSAMLSKGASAEPTLDDVFDHISDPEKMQAQMEKVGFSFIPQSWKNTSGDVGHGAAGAYLTALMALTGLSGLGAYKWTKSKSRSKAMEKAIKKRRMMRAAPQPITAIPQYTPPPRQEEDELQPQGI